MQPSSSQKLITDPAEVVVGGGCGVVGEGVEWWGRVWSGGGGCGVVGEGGEGVEW